MSSWKRFAVDSDSGRMISEQASDPLKWPCPLPGGRLMFALFDEPNTLDETPLDAATGQTAGEPRVLVHLDALARKDLTASQDGHKIVGVLERRGGHVFVADLTPGTAKLSNIRRLTSETADSYPHSWTADSKAVIFESKRLKKYRVLIQPVDQKTSEPLVFTPDDQVVPMLSPDGRWVLFLEGPVYDGPGPKRWNLMRIPVCGGEAQLVPTSGPIEEFECKYKAKRCVIIQTEGDNRFFSTSTRL